MLDLVALTPTTADLFYGVALALASLVWLFCLRRFLRQRCPACNGFGRVRHRAPESPAFWLACLACAGSGKLEQAPDYLPDWLEERTGAGLEE